MYKQITAWLVRDIWHKHHLWYFKIVSNFTRLTARELTYNNFESSVVVFMPNIITNHAITYTNTKKKSNNFERNWARLLELFLSWCFVYLSSCFFRRFFVDETLQKNGRKTARETFDRAASVRKWAQRVCGEGNFLQSIRKALPGSG